MRNPFRRRTESRVTDDGPRRLGDVFYDGSSVAAASAWPEARSLSSVPWQGFGTSMDPEKALRLAPVYSAGRLLASSVSALPLQTYRKSGGTRRQIDTPSLFEEPSQVGVLHDWLWRAMASLVYRGNAVGMITNRDYTGTPRNVEWVDPREVSVVDDQPHGAGSFVNPIWYYRGHRVDRSQLVHIPWFTLPGKVWGLSPLAAYASSVSTAFAAEQYTSDWFNNGGVPPGKFKNTKQTVEQSQAETIKKRLTSSIQSHEPIVYGADWEYDTISVPQNEARFVDTMRLTATQIAAVYGIPPEMIGGETGKSMTYANTEQQAIHFVQFTLMPWLTKLESHFSSLLPRGQYVKFNVDALIRTDAATRYQNYATARNIGLLSIDEIRALEDMEPLANGAGASHTPLVMLSGDKNADAFRSERQDGLVHGEVEKLSAWEADQRVAPHGGSTLPYGPGHELWEYWTKGEGFAKWSGATHKWTTLHRLLVKAGVPKHAAKGLTTNMIQATFPGYMEKSH